MQNWLAKIIVGQQMRHVEDIVTLQQTTNPTPRESTFLLHTHTEVYLEKYDIYLQPRALDETVFPISRDAPAVTTSTSYLINKVVEIPFQR